MRDRKRISRKRKRWLLTNAGGQMDDDPNQNL